MTYSFRQATFSDVDIIWEILANAIERRRAAGSSQWQDGYPNISVIRDDIDSGYGHVLTYACEVVAYCALLINDEPAYADLVGEWLTDSDFVVYHRVAVAEAHLGKGVAQKLLEYIEEFAGKSNIKSIKADTNFDNSGMLRIFEKMGYSYCGEVFFRGSARKAFEKVLV